VRPESKRIAFALLEAWAMTQLMEQAFERASGLPDEEQNAIASIILREIESEVRWNELFAQQRSIDLLSQMADEALAEARAGRARKLDLNDL
jgi:hypothetical protein